MYRDEKLKPPYLPAISLLSPVQQANSLAETQIYEVEPDSTFTGGFESLFSPVNILCDHLEEQPVDHGDVIGIKTLFLKVLYLSLSNKVYRVS